MEVPDRRVERQPLVALMDNSAYCRTETARENASRAFSKANADLSLQEKPSLIPQVKNAGTSLFTDDGKLSVLAVQYR